MLGYIGRRNKCRKHTPATPAAAMPELPEVETTRRSVAPSVLGRRIAKLIVYDRRLRWPVPRDLPKRLEGRTVDALSRRSKYLLFRVGDGSLLVHLGMTGSLRAHAKPPARRTP